MSLQNLLGLGSKSLPYHDFKEPFSKDNLESIMIYIHKSMFRPYDVIYEATIEFKNGSTEGKQKIKGTDYEDLMTKTKTFIDSLKK